MIVTVITCYEGSSGATYVGAVAGTMSKEQRQAFRKHYECQESAYPGDDDDDEADYMFFREVVVLPEGAMPDSTTTLLEQCDEES